jgi:outer membrane lipoprotein SlyB
MRSSYLATGLVVGVLLAGCARQATVESTGDVAISSSPADARTLPSGTTLDIRLDQEIGTKSSKVGDSFSATVVNAVLATNGVTAVPAGAKVYGKVTGLDNSDRVGEPAAIRIDFERIDVNGVSRPLYAKVTATNLETRGGDTRNETLKKAGIGAAAGAVLGGILSGGDLDKILIGGAIGAAAGTVISLGVGDVEGVLPAGTTLQLQTTRTVALR